MIDFFNAIWAILAQSGFWLLIGFLLAGLLKQCVPQRKIFKHLGGNNFSSVLKASVIGAPLPLCSCAVIPTAASLKESGASRGATTSFLIATPETGFDSVGITYALMDPIMTILRPVAAICTAIASGTLVNWTTSPKSNNEQINKTNNEQNTSSFSLKELMRFSYGKLMSDLAPWFVLGFFLSALITLFLPENFFGSTVPNGWPALLLMLIVSMPTYICATASTPIAVALIAKGLEPGAALVLLLAGPATNITTLLVLKKIIGTQAMRAYLFGLIIISLIFGLIANLIYAKTNYSLRDIVSESYQTHSLSMPEAIAGTTLGILLIWHFSAWLKKKFKRDA
jgi:uncharacterized membrane protein YraQ (UPF0718 family)